MGPLLFLVVALAVPCRLGADTVFKADFTYSPAAPLPGQAVSFTDASQGLPTSWSWDFGDGATLDCADASPTCRNPTHTYAAADTYTVTLTIIQSLGILVNIDSTTKDLHVAAPGVAPVAQFTFLPAAPAPGQTVTFTDASTGTPTSWAWDFGDGATSSSQNPTHAFAAAKTYAVALTVVNASGTSKLTKTVAVASPGTAPTAQFSFLPAAPLTGQTVSFTDASAGSPTSWAWDFGDGATSTAQNPTHAFAAANSYTVRLTASNAFGSNSTTRTVLVAARPPQAPQMDEFAVPTTVTASMGSIVTGPDNNLWATVASAVSSGIVRVSPVDGSTTVYNLPSGVCVDCLPEAIAAGRDGNLWFTEYAGSKIGRITTKGVITEFTVPGTPYGIAAGPDGNLWFTEFFGNKIGRITPAGTVTEFPVPTASAQPFRIAAGPDGNLWFTEQGANKIGRITTAGVVTEFAVPTANAYLCGIAAGPDGNLWFTEPSVHKIGRITPTGIITEFSCCWAFAIAAGPDGNLWFAGGGLGRISTAGVVTVFSVPTTGFLWGITTGPDGSLWATAQASRSVGGIFRSTTAGAMTTFAAPRDTTLPSGIAAGADGALWFTEANACQLGRVAPSGTVTESAIGSWNCAPRAIVSGPDGNVWFTAGGIHRITTSGVISDFSVDGGAFEGLAAGPDGNLWFTANGNYIGRITTAGVITKFTIPTASAGPRAIAAGPDGNLWFTELENNVGRITPAGAITEFPIPTAFSYPSGIAAGPDGNLWLTEQYGNKIGRITPAGVITEFAIPTAGSYPLGIAAGPDGNLWFTEQVGNKIGRITPAGVITEFALSTPAAAPTGIARGPDGNIWFTEAAVNRIGRLDLASACVATASTACLNAGRFRVRVAWQVPSQGTSGVGNAAALTGDTGTFWFFSSNNIELVVKVLDGRAINGNFWVFYGALSNVQYTITVTDTQTGAIKTYQNPSGQLASVADTAAFGAASVTPPSASSAEGDYGRYAALTGFPQPGGEGMTGEPRLGKIAGESAAACTPGAQTLCLNGNRFRVQVNWQVPSQGTSGVGTAVVLTGDTGYFWFFSSNNVELVIKVLDGRAINSKFWVFYGALSDVQYTITVTDTTNGAVKTYPNASGNLASVADTAAF